MSDMDEPNEAIDAKADDRSASTSEMSAEETAPRQNAPVQNDSQNPRELPDEASVERNRAMDKKATQESSDEPLGDEVGEYELEEDESEDEQDDDESEDEEYDDELEEDESEDEQDDDESEDEEYDDELEEDESEDEQDDDESEDEEYDDESEDEEYDDELEEDESEDEQDDDESEDEEYDDELEEDESEDEQDDDESEDEEYDDELEEDESEDEQDDDESEDEEYDDELEEDESEDEQDDDESEDEEYDDELEEDESEDDEGGEEMEGLAGGDAGLSVSTGHDDQNGETVAEDALESEPQHHDVYESGAKPSLGSSAGDRLSSPSVRVEGKARPQTVDSAEPQGLQFQAIDLPVMHGEPFGMRRADKNGRELLDAMAGRNSVFGFGCTPILESLVSGLSDYLGEGSRFADVKDCGHTAISKRLQQVFDAASSVSLDSMALLPSPDLAVEYALQLTRRFRSDKAFRTIALTGSDHGRTGMCRTASGLPELHEGLGPMMAGFSHLPVGDLDALRAAMDEQTAGVLLSPIDLGNGAVACEPEYLAGVRAVCNERGVLLVIDETQLVFGATGNHFSFSAIADVQADIVVASGGLFGGLSGGLVLASHHASMRLVRDLERYPLLATALLATLDEMEVHGLPEPVNNTAQELAVLIAEQLSGFEFVRDMRVTGMTIGIECDVNAVDIVAAAAANGLRVEPAGDTAIYIQPPLLISEEDRQLLLKRLVETMEAIERETAELTL